MAQLNLSHFLRLRHAFLLLILQNAMTMTTGFHTASTIPSFSSSSQSSRTALRADADDTSGGSFIQAEKDESNQSKHALFQSFREGGKTDEFRLHMPTKERTALVTDLTEVNPTRSPGSTKSFSSLAPGIWRVVYAPHIATFGIVATKLLSAVFSLSPLFNKNTEGDRKEFGDRTFSLGFDPVYYLLRPDGTMTSHARLVVTYPNDSQKKSVTWFSVAGTYSSQDEDRICRVDFDEAWVQTSENYEEDPLALPPYASLEQVPDGVTKKVINALGRFFFIDAVSTFPVSYLDDDCIVFNFELLGTRILAKKVHKLSESEDESQDAVLQFLAQEEER